MTGNKGLPNGIISFEIKVKPHHHPGRYKHWSASSGSMPDAGEKSPPQSIVSGMPAGPHRRWLKSNAIIHQLPEIYKDFKILKKKVETLENQTKKTARL